MSMKYQVSMVFQWQNMADESSCRCMNILQRPDQFGALFSRQGGQQPAAGLGIVDNLPVP